MPAHSLRRLFLYENGHYLRLFIDSEQLEKNMVNISNRRNYSVQNFPVGDVDSLLDDLKKSTIVKRYLYKKVLT